MTTQFLDRDEAGRRLAARLTSFADREKVIVLGLPRGGVPVAAHVAEALGAPLDVLVVRKLGVPGRQELAMGAVASGGASVLNFDVVTPLGITRDTIEQVAATERQELARRERAYRGDRPFRDLHGATVVLVDDGVATGATMLAAVRALKPQQPAAIIVAAPVMSVEARAALAREADDCIALATPDPFFGVGTWYQDFAQTTDAEVVACLDAARRDHARDGAGVGHDRDA